MNNWVYVKCNILDGRAINRRYYNRQPKKYNTNIVHPLHSSLVRYSCVVTVAILVCNALTIDLSKCHPSYSLETKTALFRADILNQCCFIVDLLPRCMLAVRSFQQTFLHLYLFLMISSFQLFNFLLSLHVQYTCYRIAYGTPGQALRTSFFLQCFLLLLHLMLCFFQLSARGSFLLATFNVFIGVGVWTWRRSEGIRCDTRRSGRHAGRHAW